MIEKKIQRKLFTFVPNGYGTKFYWDMNFKSTSSFHSYINKVHSKHFHTGNIAKYHDSWLRICLSQYVSCIDGNTKDVGYLVLNDNTNFQSAGSNLRETKYTSFFFGQTSKYCSRRITSV